MHAVGNRQRNIKIKTIALTKSKEITEGVDLLCHRNQLQFAFCEQKQFKTLVLAFHTDQDTLSRRLEVQVHISYT